MCTVYGEAAGRFRVKACDYEGAVVGALGSMDEGEGRPIVAHKLNTNMSLMHMCLGAKGPISDHGRRPLRASPPRL